MDDWLIEVVLIVVVGYFLYERYRQTKMKEYLASGIFIALSFAGFLLTESKIPIYACFLVVAFLFVRVWKRGP